MLLSTMDEKYKRRVTIGYRKFTKMAEANFLPPQKLLTWQKKQRIYSKGFNLLKLWPRNAWNATIRNR
jgi:hypothetical protein